MNETTALNNLAATLKIDSTWWQELLGQKASYTEGEFDLYKAMESLPRTEVTAAEAIKKKFGNALSYSPAEGIWYLWDGRVHAPCKGEAIAYKVVKLYYKSVTSSLKFVKDHYVKQAQGAKVSGGDKADEKAAAIMATYEKGEWTKHRSFRDRLATDAGISAVVRLLRTECDIPADHFEGDRKFFVVRNGVIDIENYRRFGVVNLMEHDAARPVYRYFDADYNPATVHEDYETWRKYLATSIIDWDTVILLQKGVGAAFSGERKPRALFNLLGAPASGKSVFLSVFSKLGQDYSIMPNNQSIQTNAGDTNFYQDELRNARFVGFSEVQGNKSLDDGFIKSIMGGDEQTTRKIRQDTNKWTPQCVMFIASNKALKFDTRDDATFLKILPIPFPHSFTETDPEHKMDRLLEDKVLAEGSGILHWILEGMKLFWRDGLNPTAAVLEAMDGNKTANSSALQFMEALIENGYINNDPQGTKSSFITIGEAFSCFKIWADHQGIKHVPGKQTFSADIKNFYHGEANSGGKRFAGLVKTEALETRLANQVWLNTLMGELEVEQN